MEWFGLPTQDDRVHLRLCHVTIVASTTDNLGFIGTAEVMISVTRRLVEAGRRTARKAPVVTGPMGLQTLTGIITSSRPGPDDL